MKFVRGRKPVPYKLKVLTQSAPGFDRGGHAIKVPPPFAKGGVEKPPDLSPDADEFWDRVVPELERVGIRNSVEFDFGPQRLPFVTIVLAPTTFAQVV
jgi:phage terminase small subunit